MYEQFYRVGTNDDKGTHYTPPELVEYVLERVLTDDILKTNPRICDPACGSGIFLVEAFRRLVRHASSTRGRALGSEELQELLLNRVVGVDLNPEAVRLAAFSLYLAYLNYLDPRDILRAGPLPPLIHRSDTATLERCWSQLTHFSPHVTKQPARAPYAFPGLLEPLMLWWETHPGPRPAGLGFNWGDQWASDRELPVGERSPSQLFLWRSLSFLKPGGVAALLVSATALHNSRPTSVRFRSRWLQRWNCARFLTSLVLVPCSLKAASLHSCCSSSNPGGAHLPQRRQGGSCTAESDHRGRWHPPGHSHMPISNDDGSTRTRSPTAITSGRRTPGESSRRSTHGSP